MYKKDRGFNEETTIRGLIVSKVTQVRIIFPLLRTQYIFENAPSKDIGLNGKES